jgi:hypothetical protein
MTAAASATNLVVGLVFLLVGTLIVIELVRDSRRRGFSHFGAAWLAMAFTCGMHHWIHGIHLGFEGRTAGSLDLIAVAVGLPAGVIWAGLRLEAFGGGRGDRLISGSPGWMIALPPLLGAYLTALVLGAAAEGAGELHLEAARLIVPNLMLVVLYAAIAAFMLKTQVSNRRPLGGWSLSGVALGLVFSTCALMHGIYSFYALSGQYVPDPHGVVIDWLCVPAAFYFLWMVRALDHGGYRDWNGAPSTSRAWAAAAR